MPGRPALSADTGGESPRARELAMVDQMGAPAEGADSSWIDRFMESILERNYDAAREVLRAALARGISQRLAQQYAGVLEEFMTKCDEVENPALVDRQGTVMVRELGGSRGRGLVVPGFVSWGGELYNERPLAYIQSPESRRCVQVCYACLVPVGSLASQLAHMGLPAPAATEALTMPAAGGMMVACLGDGCAEVFCSEACRDWALEESPHAVLCNDQLPPERREALRAIERLAEEADSEHLLLLAHCVAAMFLQRRRGTPPEEVLHHYAGQFVSQPWDDPTLCKLSDTTPEVRRGLLTQIEGLLRQLFAGEEELAGPFLEPALLSGLLGTFELVNMCISISHPLNQSGARLSEILGGDTLASIKEIQRAAEESDSDEENDPEAEGHLGQDNGKDCRAEERAVKVAQAEAEAVDAARDGSLFANVVGTSLCPMLSFTNHSCLPNCRIDFASGFDPPGNGPGLWVHAVARRPLLPGDEVLMAYVPSVVGRPLEYRQQKMEAFFGFPCQCRSCITDEMLATEGTPV